MRRNFLQERKTASAAAERRQGELVGVYSLFMLVVALVALVIARRRGLNWRRAIVCALGAFEVAFVALGLVSTAGVRDLFPH